MQGDLDALPALITHYLNHEPQREQLTSAAYDLVSTELTWERSVSRILRTLEAR